MSTKITKTVVTKGSAKPKSDKFKPYRPTRKQKTVKSISIPIAKSTITSAGKMSMKQDTNHTVISGYDMIYPTRDESKAISAGVFALIPANPAVWNGTRLQAIALTYQRYRPLSFVAEYIPVVPVTMQGQVTCGSYWQTSSSENTTQQFLLTSPGGHLAPVYQRFRSRIACNKDTLPQENFKICSNYSDPESCPFVWAIRLDAPSPDMKTQPGYIMLKWKYEFLLPATTGQGLGASVTEPTEEVKTHCLKKGLSASNGIFGLTLAALKLMGKQLLTNVSVFLVNQAKTIGSQAIEYGIGKILDWKVKNLDNHNAATSELYDPVSSQDVVLPDDTQVVVFTTGRNVENSTPSPTPTQVSTFIYPIEEATYVSDIEQSIKQVDTITNPETLQLTSGEVWLTFNESHYTYEFYINEMSDSNRFRFMGATPMAQTMKMPADRFKVFYQSQLLTYNELLVKIKPTEEQVLIKQQQQQIESLIYKQQELIDKMKIMSRYKKAVIDMASDESSGESDI